MNALRSTLFMDVENYALSGISVLLLYLKQYLYFLVFAYILAISIYIYICLY